MNQPADDQPTLLRERLDQLADTVDGGESFDGARLYRLSVRRQRRRIAAATGLIAAGVIMAAALGSVARPEASPEILPPSADSPSPSSGCEIPDRLAQAIEMGALTEEEACRIVRRGEQAIEARQRPPDFPEGPSLVIEGSVNQEWVAQCRTGSFPVGEGYKAAELYCNAILKIAAGELEPNETCGPPECSHPGTPVWAYGEAELRALADTNRE